MSEVHDRIEALERELRGAPPIRIVDRALELHGDDIALSFSGAEDVLLIELAKQTRRPFRVFCLDTGRLHPETHRFIRRVEEHYELRVHVRAPQARAVEDLGARRGLFSFYDDGHAECCGIRKVEPLRRQLATLTGWITGQRRDQSPGTRASVPVVELDGAHPGLDGRPVVKWNPLAARTSVDVWDAIRAFEVPHNPLHERGFVSIGCEPCTRPILPGQHEREGRWWWEQADKKECGLHEINVPSDPDEPA
ncbi:MAG: phosphoadenylyl-sulfate reductase [Myxococcales bacterium]|nr:phosphoadenylyl-sulfate reductase [Myxococcales bacterium]